MCSQGAARVVNCGRVHPNRRHNHLARGNDKPVNAIQRGPRLIDLQRKSPAKFSVCATQLHAEGYSQGPRFPGIAKILLSDDF